MRPDDKTAAELFRRYSKRLYDTALRMTMSSDEAEEIMQETLIRYLTGNVSVLSGSEWSWLRTTAVRLSVDWLRGQRRFVEIEDALGEKDVPEELPQEDDIWDRLDGNVFPTVMRLISEMPDGYRTVLMLRLMEEYGYPEIASMLGITESGVRSQFLRARRLLAEKLLAVYKNY